MRVSEDARGLISRRLAEEVREMAGEGAPALDLARPPNAEHGDYAAPAGPRLASRLRRSPREIAEDLVARLGSVDGVAAAEAVNGYVNFRLSPAYLRGVLGEVVAAGPRYGASELGRGQKVQVEFVSINPTGPLHIGHGRGAILGDTLARLLALTGHQVHREYYVNDYGTQARKFGQSIQARMRGEDPPVGGYMGAYVADLARLLTDAGLSPNQTEEVTKRGIEAMRVEIEGTLNRLGITFNTWFSERDLWDGSIVAHTPVGQLPIAEAATARAAHLALKRLDNANKLNAHDGAWWFVAEGDDRDSEDEDRVVIRSDGLHTYFASDLGYALDRLERRYYDRVIEVWGADHHGYVARFKAGIQALGLDPERVEIILHQMVNLKGGKVSKRAGRFVTLDELIDMVGVDPVRYFYLMRSPEAMMDFDLDLALAQSNENPVYYAQYAHARLVNVEKEAEKRHGTLPANANLELIERPWELDVARQLAFWPETVETATKLREPHRIPYYVHDLADRVHHFYHRGNEDGSLRVVTDDPELTRARIELCRAARTVLKSALDLMGVSAPERM